MAQQREVEVARQALRVGTQTRIPSPLARTDLPQNGCASAGAPVLSSEEHGVALPHGLHSPPSNSSYWAACAQPWQGVQARRAVTAEAMKRVDALALEPTGEASVSLPCILILCSDVHGTLLIQPMQRPCQGSTAADVVVQGEQQADISRTDEHVETAHCVAEGEADHLQEMRGWAHDKKMEGLATVTARATTSAADSLAEIEAKTPAQGGSSTTARRVRACLICTS